MPKELALCNLCGEPMPEGETMFKYHGYSGPCPQLPKKKTEPVVDEIESLRAQVKALGGENTRFKEALNHICKPELDECCKKAWHNDALENHYHFLADRALGIVERKGERG